MWCAVRGINYLLLFLIRRLYRLEIHGLEHLPPSGHYLVACRHSSRADLFGVALLLDYVMKTPGKVIAMMAMAIVTNSRIIARLVREGGILRA